MGGRKKNQLTKVTLPLDICTEILVKLPTKPLLRFRCASQLWCSLIDEPQFTFNHLKGCLKNQERSRLLVLEPPKKCDPDKQVCTLRSADKFRKLSTIDIDIRLCEPYIATGYVNGLLCMKSYESETQVPKILLWNPSIRKALEIPNPEKLTVEEKYDIDLAFGYDPIRNDYKLVASLYGLSNTFILKFIEIYTLSTNSWRSFNFGINNSTWLKDSPKIYLDGVIYWTGIDLLKATPKGRFSHFVSFDVSREVLEYIELPDCEPYYVWNQESFPIILDQSLALLEVFHTHSNIWVMDEAVWTKRYNIQLELLYKYFHLDTDGDLIIAGKKGGAFSYNLESQQTKVLAKSYKIYPLFMGVYVDSLVLLNGLPEGNYTYFPSPI